MNTHVVERFLKKIFMNKKIEKLEQTKETNSKSLKKSSICLANDEEKELLWMKFELSCRNAFLKMILIFH